MTQTLNGTLVAVVDNGKILLIKRAKEPYKGQWAMIGGKIEFGEHPQETAVREVKEETGLDATFEGMKGILSEVLHNGEKVEHFLLYLSQVKPLHTNIVESDEGELAWFPLDKLPDQMVLSDRRLIEECIIKESTMKVHRAKVVQDGESYILEEFTS